MVETVEMWPEIILVGAPNSSRSPYFIYFFLSTMNMHKIIFTRDLDTCRAQTEPQCCLYLNDQVCTSHVL